MNFREYKIRRPKAYMSPLATNLIHLRNPVVIALWSSVFPGFGHIALGQYIKGYILILWEIVVNTQSHLNLVILYTFTGRFQEAAAVANPRWLLLYNAVFVYCLWDSYRTTVDLNKLAVLADRSDDAIVPERMNSFAVNFLDKRNPWIAAAWSILMPGLGHLYTYRLPAGFFLLLWWVAIAYFSHLLEVLNYTFWGDFAKAAAVADWEWLLFMPSIHLFAVYDSYVSTVEDNKLFTREQTDYLRREYNNSAAIAALSKETEEAMFIISTFEHSLLLELAISAIEAGGIAKSNIFAAPLEVKQQQAHILDTIRQADGISQLDGALLAGAFSSVVFTVFGSILPGGPLVWGLFGLFAGGGVGLAVDALHTGKSRRKTASASGQVVLIIKCEESQASFVEQVLTSHCVLGIATAK